MPSAKKKAENVADNVCEYIYAFLMYSTNKYTWLHHQFSGMNRLDGANQITCNKVNKNKRVDSWSAVRLEVIY